MHAKRGPSREVAVGTPLTTMTPMPTAQIQEMSGYKLLTRMGTSDAALAAVVSSRRAF